MRCLRCLRRGGRRRLSMRRVQGDLRSHFFAHVAFGDLDCYQWLVAMGQHTLRHVAQIEEIKAAWG